VKGIDTIKLKNEKHHPSTNQPIKEYSEHSSSSGYNIIEDVHKECFYGKKLIRIPRRFYSGIRTVAEG